MFLLSWKARRRVQVALDTNTRQLHEQLLSQVCLCYKSRAHILALLPSLCGRAAQLLGSCDQDWISQKFSNEIQQLILIVLKYPSCTLNSFEHLQSLVITKALLRSSLQGRCVTEDFRSMSQIKTRKLQAWLQLLYVKLPPFLTF